MKTRTKVLSSILFTALILLNITSTMKLSFGGEAAQSRSFDIVDCWSNYQWQFNYSMIWCAQCENRNNSRGSGVNGHCGYQSPPNN